LEWWKYTLGDFPDPLTSSVAVTALCPGDAIDVAFNFNCTSLPGNVYTAELSDASGSFSTPVVIGSFTSTDASGIIPSIIPNLTPSGTHYRIRVVASAPFTIGKDNGTDLTITCPTPAGLSSSNITTISAKLSWNEVSCANKYQLLYREVNGTWQNANVNGETKTLSGLLPSTTYQWKVRSKCASGPNVYSAFSPIQVFTTAPLKIDENVSGDYVTLNIYPNPFMKEAIIQFAVSENSFVTIELLDLSGRKIKTIAEGNYEAGNHQFLLQKKNLPAGIYYIQGITNSGFQTLKVILQ
jgi:hypothetical protein